MDKEIRKYYDRIKLTQQFANKPQDTDEPPITHTKVFHKEYPRLPSIPLAEVEQDLSEFRQLLNSRGSYRNFSDEPISFENISSILDSCRIIDNAREPESRTYPSGGARFPVELYLLTNNVNGLDKGAYHYSMKDRKLELLVKRDWSKINDNIVSPYINNPGASIFFTSVISRSEVKYGLRAYPYSLIEAGHMGQNIQLSANQMNISSCPVSGFVDDVIIELLDLGPNELPIYSIVLGNKNNGKKD
jgi:SagB-type dehydrogenase family enzyme